jgi:hypothetical protein
MCDTSVIVEPLPNAFIITKDRASGRTGLLLLAERKDAPGSYELVCFGPAKHYRKDGTCRCIEAVLAEMGAEARANTTVDPFGGKGGGGG